MKKKIKSKLLQKMYRNNKYNYRAGGGGEGKAVEVKKQ